MTDVPRDEDLVAYLDGELTGAEHGRVAASIASDATVAARAAAFSGATQGLRDAFAPLLAEAPTTRLEEMLASLDAPAAKAPRGGWTRRRMLAAGIALVACGGLADHLVLAPRGTVVAVDSGHWREIVASYVRLYTPQTFADSPDDAGLRARELATVGDAIGVRLTPGAVDLASVALKDARILRYDSTPLAEINYLDARYGPMALCIVPSDQTAAAPRVERRHGLNVAYWNDGHHGFMIIGARPQADLATMAQSLAGRLAA